MNTMMVAVSLLAVLMATPVEAQTEASRYSEKVLLKNWALSRCLAEVSQDEKTKEDANATASAYLEFGHQSMKAYEVLSELVTKYAHRRYAGSVDTDFNTMKCIDLLNSRELERLTTKLSRGK